MRSWLVPCLLAAAVMVAGCSGTTKRTPGNTLPPVGDPPAAAQPPVQLHAPEPARWLADAATLPPPTDVPALEEIAVARVSLGMPTPPDRHPLPLTPATARDRTVIEKLRGWLAASRVIGGEIHAPGRSPSLVLELRGGEVRSLRLAYDCVVTQTADSRREQCQRAEGQVIFSGNAGQEPQRLDAPELAAWLVQGWEQDVLRGTPPTGLIQEGTR